MNEQYISDEEFDALSEIEEVSPDEWDLKMLADIERNPDCQEFISQEELLKNLDFTL